MVWYSWYLSRKLHESTGAGLQTEYPIVVLSTLLFLMKQNKTKQKQIKKNF